MKRVRLNNKGMTAVEILVSFILMTILMVSMYGTVNKYKNKQNINQNYTIRRIRFPQLF